MLLPYSSGASHLVLNPEPGSQLCTIAFQVLLMETTLKHAPSLSEHSGPHARVSLGDGQLIW